MKRILLIEDTVHLAEEIADILRLEGYFVTVANDGTQGLGVLVGTNPDLIITDLMMPGLDGFELIRQVRAMPVYKSIPIIILSAKTSEADRKMGTDVGANAFIQKPCKIPELLASIKPLINYELQITSDE